MKKKIFTKEVKIGIAFIVALFLLYFGINFLKGINIFKPANDYVVTFDNVSGMLVSDPVTINGLKIGQVKSMNYSPEVSNNIFVQIQMEKDIKIPRGSKIKLDAGIIGSSALILDVPSKTNTFYNPGDTIIGEKKAGMLDAVGNMVPKVDNLMSQLDSVLLTVNATLTPKLAETLEKTNLLMEEFQKTAIQANSIMITLNKDLPQITSNLNKTIDNVEGITHQVNTMDLVSTFQKLDSTIANIETLSTKLNSKDNSIGLLFNDKQLYDSINSVLNNASNLLLDVRKNPSKYINVKVF